MMFFEHCYRCMELADSYPCPHCGYDPGRHQSYDYALKPGTIVNGKYVVGLPLGQGGFGITYIGWDLSKQEKVAIKEYFPSGQVSRSSTESSRLQWFNTELASRAQRDGKDTFLREARKMARVSGIPLVVNVWEVFEDNGTAYIVMDFIEGETLKDRLKKTGPMTWDQAKDIFLPVVEAMAQVHEKGLIHRDLSPDNLMLQPDGTVRILDLGAAKDLNLNSGASSMQVAKSGFSPLEQYTQRGGSGSWTDVYALAATMYYTLTGVVPPSAVDRVSGVEMKWDLPQMAAMPENVRDAMKKAMVLMSKDRTQDMTAFYRQLTLTGLRQEQEKSQDQQQQRDQTDQTDTVPDDEIVPTKKKTDLYRKICAVVAVVCLLGAMLFWDAAKEAEKGSADAGTQSQERMDKASDKNLGTDLNQDAQYAAMIGKGVREDYSYANRAKLSLYFDKQEQECCRIYTNKDNEVELIFTAVYDGDGNLTEHRIYDGEGIMQCTTFSQYNASGDVVSAKVYDGNKALVRSREWTYDSQGRSKSFVEKAGDGTVLETGSSTYDASGVETYTSQDIDGSQFVRHSDPDGNCLDYTEFDTDGNQQYRGEYTYDSQGRETEWRYYHLDKLSSRTESQYSGDKLVQEKYYSYSYYSGKEFVSTREMRYGPRDICFGYEENGAFGRDMKEYVETISGRVMRLLETALEEGEYAANSVSYYHWLGEYMSSESYQLDGTLSSKNETHFDSNWKKTGSTYTYYSSYNDTHTVTEYDAQGSILWSKTFDASDILVGRSEYTYKGNMQVRKSYDAAGALTGRTETCYNDNGDELWEKTYDADDFMYSENEYTYDQNGDRTGRIYTYYSKYNGQKTVTEYDNNFNQISEKTYDANGKLIKSE